MWSSVLLLFHLDPPPSNWTPLLEARALLGCLLIHQAALTFPVLWSLLRAPLTSPCTPSDNSLPKVFLKFVQFLGLYTLPTHLKISAQVFLPLPHPGATKSQVPAWLQTPNPPPWVWALIGRALASDWNVCPKSWQKSLDFSFFTDICYGKHLQKCLPEFKLHCSIHCCDFNIYLKGVLRL